MQPFVQKVAFIAPTNENKQLQASKNLKTRLFQTKVWMRISPWEGYYIKRDRELRPKNTLFLSD